MKCFVPLLRCIGMGLLLASAGCSQSDALFERLPASRTGIHFVNAIQESDSLNILDFEYLYNGGGVGVGDFNGDGLQDLFFSANQGACKLYINKGNFNFLDVTQQAGIYTPHWNTGVSLVDINSDGLLDIYLSTAHPHIDGHAPNQLFINKGIDADGVPRFTESAKEVGLADEGYSTQAAFFDYDKDGDLDCYVLTNALEHFDRALPLGQRSDGGGRSTDRLYRNDGKNPNGLPHFTNVSQQAGITIEGWGLGIGIVDINNDGWPDVYCANDFQSNDLLWVNNGDGTFTNRIAEYIKHQSANSMGMDIADLTNDGLPEIVNLDMMPDDNLRQKTMFSKPNQDFYQMQESKGYQPQFVRNSLQWHRGFDAEGRPQFSEVGYYSGIYATDWSWAALLADWDNDGWKDLLVTNGYPKDISNLDFTAYTAQSLVSSSATGQAGKQQKLEKMAGLLGVKKSNFLFRNKGNLQFEDVTQKWGMEAPSFSNGAAYADLDGDGDLDVVVNNINDKAFVYRNTLNEKKDSKGKANFIRVQLLGGARNEGGFGATVSVYHGGRMQRIQHSPYRGYKSTVEPFLHFGLGDSNVIDSIVVQWPDGAVQVLQKVLVNRTVQIAIKDAGFKKPEGVYTKPWFTPFTTKGLQYRHEETDYNDFNSGFLLPHKFSQYGPAMAVGDLNGDGLEDLFIGGAMRRAATVFYQQQNATFKQVPFLDKISEDAGVLLFDADTDGDEDVYCVSGSSEFGRNAARCQDRLYRNMGSGRFVHDSAALPPTTAIGSCVAAADFDKDGDLDLFVGGRVEAGAYPLPPRSYLLRNRGDGSFTDATQVAAPPLLRPGMVTAALWTDYNSDGWTDLILVGEFMPITFIRNNKGVLQQDNNNLQQPGNGWWHSLVSGDFDNDGDMDYVAGNTGLNSLYKASPEQPVCVYVKDYNGDQRIDPIMCRYIQNQEYPAHYRESMTEQISELRKALPSYAAYGHKSWSQLFRPGQLADTTVFKITHLASVYLENKGNGKFTTRQLPLEAQVAPIYGMLAEDVNGDGNMDLLAAGNDYSTETLTGRYDAGYGLLLWGNGKRGFRPAPLHQSGFIARGDAKAMVSLQLQGGRRLYCISQNKDSLVVMAAPPPQGSSIHVQPDDVAAVMQWGNGKMRLQELHYGSGYLSQPSRKLIVPQGVRKVALKNARGKVRMVDIPESR